MKLQIFQIFRDEQTRQKLDPGFVALDDAACPRPEWRDYWAIRSFFQNHSVDEAELYGFLDADFGDKTSLSADSIRAFIENNPEHDVYTFSPSIQDGACYLNVFEQGNHLCPGFIELTEAYLREIGLDFDVRTLPMDAVSTVFCNYIVAKPSFWRTWFALTEKLFELVDGEDGDFRRHLDSIALGRPPMSLVILLIERIASLVLTLDEGIKVWAFDVRSMPLSNPLYSVYQRQMVFLNEIKASYRKAEDKSKVSNFYALRGAILQACEGKRLGRAKDGFLTTQLQASPELLYVCFTHVEQPFQYPPFVSTMYLGEAQGAGKANLRDLAPEWEPHHPLLGATAGSFALKNYIVENQLKVRHVGICQYRKFVSTERVSGVAASNYPLMDTVSRASLDEGLLSRAMLPGDREFLLGKAGVVKGGYFNQYRDAHVAEDFLRFTAEAVELGVLSRQDVMTFFTNDGFMPGGLEIGVFPADFWVRAISSVEAVVRGCIERYPGRRQGYQVRAWAFCAERLGSFLLLKHLASTYDTSTWQEQFLGQLNLVTEDEQAMYVVGR